MNAISNQIKGKAYEPEFRDLIWNIGVEFIKDSYVTLKIKVP